MTSRTLAVLAAVALPMFAPAAEPPNRDHKPSPWK
jgi:hypothetical protein